MQPRLLIPTRSRALPSTSRPGLICLLQLLSCNGDLLVFLPGTRQSLWPHLSSGNTSTLCASTCREQGMLGASMCTHAVLLRAQLRSPGVCACARQSAGLPSHLKKDIASCLPFCVSSVGLKHFCSLILCNQPS